MSDKCCGIVIIMNDGMYLTFRHSTGHTGEKSKYGRIADVNGAYIFSAIEVNRIPRYIMKDAVARIGATVERKVTLRKL